MTTPLAGHLVTCDNCGTATVVTTGGSNVHDALNCKCCGPDHTHADENGCTQQSCRTVTVSANAVTIPGPGGGQ